MTGLDFRSLSPNQQHSIRKQAMRLLKKGHSKAQVARELGVSRMAVHTWCKRREEGGATALRPNPRGRSPGGKLSPQQSRQIQRAIMDRTPDQLKLPFYLWTREAVSQVIKNQNTQTQGCYGYLT